MSMRPYPSIRPPHTHERPNATTTTTRRSTTPCGRTCPRCGRCSPPSTSVTSATSLRRHVGLVVVSLCGLFGREEQGRFGVSRQGRVWRFSSTGVVPHDGRPCMLWKKKCGGRPLSSTNIPPSCFRHFSPHAHDLPACPCPTTKRRREQSFLPTYLKALLRLKRINEMGTQQLLLDVYSLKTLMLQVRTGAVALRVGHGARAHAGTHRRASIQCKRPRKTVLTCPSYTHSFLTWNNNRRRLWGWPRGTGAEEAPPRLSRPPTPNT